MTTKQKKGCTLSKPTREKLFRIWFDKLIKETTVRDGCGWEIFGDCYGTGESKNKARRLFREDYEEIAKLAFLAGLKEVIA